EARFHLYEPARPRQPERLLRGEGERGGAGRVQAPAARVRREGENSRQCRRLPGPVRARRDGGGLPRAGVVRRGEGRRRGRDHQAAPLRRRSGRTPADEVRPAVSASSAPPPAAPAVWSVLDVIKWTAARFKERALATPRLDAELLVAHVLGLPRVQLYVQFDRPLGPDELAAIRELIKRRQAGECVAYLVGK